MIIKTKFLLPVALILAACNPVEQGNTAQSEMTEKEAAIDLRRTTLIVKNMEQSLAFYRDALGLKVTYDNLILSPRDAASEENADWSAQLVFLRPEGSFGSVVGLLHYRRPERDMPESQPAPFMPGSVALVFNAEDAQAAFDRAKDVPGVGVINAPYETSYPSYDGEGIIPVLNGRLVDPNGHAIEIIQFLEGDPLKQ